MEPGFEPRTAGLSLFLLFSFDTETWCQAGERRTQAGFRPHTQANLTIKRVAILLLEEGL